LKTIGHSLKIWVPLRTLFVPPGVPSCSYRPGVWCSTC